MSEAKSIQPSRTGFDFVLWLASDLEGFYRKFTSSHFDGNAAKWKFRVAARILHGLFPSVAVSEMKSHFLSILHQKDRGEDEETVWRHFLTVLDDPRLLGGIAGYAGWLGEIFSDKTTYSILPKVASERLRLLARPWVNRFLPQFQTFLREKWEEGMAKRDLIGQVQFNDRFQLALAQAEKKCYGSWNESGIFWVYCLMLAGWFEVAECRSVRKLYGWLGQFLPTSKIGSLEALQKTCA